MDGRSAELLLQAYAILKARLQDETAGGKVVGSGHIAQGDAKRRTAPGGTNTIDENQAVSPTCYGTPAG